MIPIPGFQPSVSGKKVMFRAPKKAASLMFIPIWVDERFLVSADQYQSSLAKLLSALSSVYARKAL